MRTRPIDLTPKDVARFWSKVGDADANGCTLWTGRANPSGHGDFRFGSMRDGSSATFLAHRVAYTLVNGPIPNGMGIDHACHVTMCVASAHLRLADQTQNMTNRPGAQRNSRSGIRGVSWHAYTKKWKAQAQMHGQSFHLGVYEDIREAEAAVVAWRREHMPYSVADQRVSA